MKKDVHGMRMGLGETGLREGGVEWIQFIQDTGWRVFMNTVMNFGFWRHVIL
jgi:hypothetical protein